MENFIIRNFEPADYNQVIQLWMMLDLGNPERGDDLAIIEQTILKGGFFLVMINTTDASLVGTSWITNDGRRLYLHHFGIHPAWQNQGLAKLLLEKSLQLARKTHLQIKLEVGNENLPALKLYQNAGFRPLGDYQVFIIRKYD